MPKYYASRFGDSDNPSTFSGLTPTFTIFYRLDTGATLTPPSISEVLSSGLYAWQYTPTVPILFQLDGGAAVATGRYVNGTLDPIQGIDLSLGYPTDSYGSTLAASTIGGQVNRAVAYFEATATFDKTTGVWSQYATGTSTLILEKTLTNTSTQATKS